VRFAVFALVALAGLSVAARASAASCESLKGLSRPGTTVTLAQAVAAGQFTPPAGRAGAGRGGANPFAQLPEFCRIAATLTPGK